MKTDLATRANPFLGPIEEPAPEASFDDLDPPATFLVSLDAPADGFTTDAKSFFGAGGAGQPSGLAGGLDGSLSTTGPESGMILERRIALAPGEQRTLYFLYGYLPHGTEVEALVKKYRSAAAGVWRDSSRQWKDKGLRLSLIHI